MAGEAVGLGAWAATGDWTDGLGAATGIGGKPGKYKGTIFFTTNDHFMCIVGLLLLGHL